MNNGYYPPPYGQDPRQQSYCPPPYQGYNPSAPFGYPPSPYTVEAQNKASTARTFGIISLVGLVFMGILSIIFGILAITNANQAKRLIGYDLPDGKSGRTFGIVSLSILGGIVAIWLFLVCFLRFFALTLVAAGL